MPTRSDITIKSSKQRKKGYTITTSEGETLKMPTEVVFRHQVYTDRSFSPAKWKQIVRETEDTLCYEAMLRLLGQRFHAEQEMKRKLYKRDFHKRSVEAALEKGRELGLLDDRRFARLFAEERLELARASKRKIIGQLRQRGIDREIVDEVMDDLAEQVSPEAMFEQALKVAQQRRYQYQREEDPYKRKQKILRMLANRGYSSQVCYRVVDALREEADDG